MTVELKPLPPEDALEFFRQKGLAPPDARFDYRDVWRNEHARAFVVAKAMRTEVLETIRKALDTALEEGQSLAQFTEALEPELKRLGWWGKSMERDPLTGALTKVQLGSARRLSIIFDANMRASHAAGKWRRVQRVKERFPFLRYIQIQRETKREAHALYHELIRPVDDPIWARIWPPNGWRCGCTVQQLSQRQLDRRGLKVTEGFVLKERGVLNKRTGEIEPTALGVDPAWDGNPGMDWAGMTRLPSAPGPSAPARRVERYGVIDDPFEFAYGAPPADAPLPGPVDSDAVRFYQGVGFAELHRALRGSLPLTPDLDRHRQSLDREIARSPVPEGTFLYRGLREIEAPEVGDILLEKGFASFSRSSAVAATIAERGHPSGVARRARENIVLRLRAPEGLRGAWLGGFEDEVLLGRGLRAVIASVQEIRFPNRDKEGVVHRLKVYDIVVLDDET